MSGINKLLYEMDLMDRLLDLKLNGKIPVCGYRMEDPGALFSTCMREVGREGELCFFHKKRKAGLI